MIHFKSHNKNVKNHNKNGFTFIEIVITVAVIGIMMSAIFGLQSGMFRSIFGNYSKVSRIFYIKNLFFEPANLEKLQKDKIIKKDLSDPATNIVYELKKPGDKSGYSKRFENINLLKATGKWKGLFKEQEEMLISFVYIKPKKK